MMAAPIVGPITTVRCWDRGAPAKHCTLPPRHEGNHLHEYSGLSWPAERSTK